jgi:hypothetical protein
VRGVARVVADGWRGQEPSHLLCTIFDRTVLIKTIRDMWILRDGWFGLPTRKGGRKNLIREMFSNLFSHVCAEMILINIKHIINKCKKSLQK